MTFNQLAVVDKFSRKDFFDAYKEKYGDKSEYAIDYALRKAISEGIIYHLGRNQYAYGKQKHTYAHSYSEEATRVANEINEKYPEVDFRVFELMQLNRFVNHQFAHNTIFISVENDVVDYIFDSLRNEYPGRIMLKPKVDEYYRYLVDDQIVVLRLPSETPKGVGEFWKSRLEKILVDITVDKLMSKIVSESEYHLIFSEAFNRYFLDLSAMYRYANRKGAGRKFKKLLDEYT